MKETGIIMSGNHPELIIKGDKTMTRRTYGLEFVNQDPDAYRFIRMEGDLAVFRKVRNASMNAGEIPSIPLSSFPKKMGGEEPNILFYIRCPYGGVGDWLYIMETFCETTNGSLVYRASETPYAIGKDGVEIYTYHCWRPSIHMPKKFARLWREIVSVRAERLQDITPSDCAREGIEYQTHFPLQDTMITQRFALLWDTLNPKHPWSRNEWVWPIEFRVIGKENGV